MNLHNVTRQVGLDVAVAPAAAGATLVKGNAIDVSGYESVAFAVQFGTITATAVVAVKVQASDTTTDGDFVDVPNASVAVPDSSSDKGVLSVEVHRPTKRYYRVAVSRATANAVVAGGFVLLGRAGSTPAAKGAAMINNAPAVLVSVP